MAETLAKFTTLNCELKLSMDLKKIGVNTRNWVDSAQDRDYWRAPVNVALNLQVA